MLSCGACVCVSDRTNDAVFVAFDMEMDKLTNLQTEVAHILVTGVDAHVDTNSPRLLLILLERLHFPAQAKRVQFYFHTPNFTTSCIITELQRAPLLAFVVDGGNNGSGPSGGDKPGGNPLASKVSADDNNAIVEAACVYIRNYSFHVFYFNSLFSPPAFTNHLKEMLFDSPRLHVFSLQSNTFI
ncbi:BnaC06g24520D [Brassica napus]|uniref:(rape) hypothetical protein n=1 Tax=Brassica napus TaxID=3708 RepID=A0A078GFR7_BRANA|nr:unnamed protein product [Brassica napus]CDY23483.1 BnaC06g24520D [Brassica napus]